MKYRLLPLLGGALCLGLQVSAAAQSKSWDDYVKIGRDGFAQKQYAESEQAYREALKLTEKFKSNDPRVAATLIELAESLSLQSKRAEAEAFANRALVALDKALKASKSENLRLRFYQSDGSAILSDKAATIFEAGQKYDDEAETLYKKVIAIREEAVQPHESPKPKTNEDFMSFLSQTLDSPRIKLADAYDKLARMYLSQHKFDEAEPLYAKALKVVEAEYGADQSPTAMSLSRLATLYAMQGKPDRAEPLYSRAVLILESEKNLALPEAAIVYENYSLFLRKTGHEAQAAAMFEKAKAVRSRIPSPAN